MVAATGAQGIEPNVPMREGSLFLAKVFDRAEALGSIDGLESIDSNCHLSAYLTDPGSRQGQMLTRE